MALTVTLAIVGLLIPTAVLHGQEAETIIRTETRLALLRFHAVHKNQYVDDLRPEDIQLLEDGKPQSWRSSKALGLRVANADSTGSDPAVRCEPERDRRKPAQPFSF